MCKNCIYFFIKIGEKKGIIFLKNILRSRRMKFVLIVNLFIVTSLYNIEFIIHSNIFLKLFLLLIGLFLIAIGFINGFLILEESVGDLQYLYYRIYYCLSFLVVFFISIFIIYLIVNILLSPSLPNCV